MRNQWEEPSIISEYSYDPQFKPILDKIRQHISWETIVEFFTSYPNETGGERRFPYFRIDTATYNIRDNIDLCKIALQKTPIDTEKATSCYNRASYEAVRLLLWVDIGFEGLENYANSKFANSNFRVTIEHLRKSWQQTYENAMIKFVRYRNENNIADDCFTQYHLELLLDRYQS